MRKAGKSTLTTISLIGTAVIATAAATFSATWTFLPGGAITAQNTFPLTATNLDTGGALVCDVSTAKATAKSGSGLTGEALVSIDSITFATPGNPGNACTGPSSDGTLTAIGLPWKFNAESFDAATGKVTGRVTGVMINLHASAQCDATFGAPDGGPAYLGLTYTNSTGEINLTGEGNLMTNSADVDCEPLLYSGDRISVDGQYESTPKQTVTSP